MATTEFVQFPQVISVGCGIDVHQQEVTATIGKGTNEFETRCFETYTESLEGLRDWCKESGVTHVAMESTGVYWKPVFNVLEEDFEVILVNARHIKNVPGHKTDKKDSVWITKLLLSGLLKGSFIPSVQMRELRDLMRYRKKQVQQIASEKNRMIKILEDANIKLSSVLTNVDGVTGQAIVNDLIDGNTDIDSLLKHVHGKVKASRDTIRKALHGRLTSHHRFMLGTMRQSIADKEKIIQQLDKHIDQITATFKPEIELLQSIDGIGKESAIAIISEIGTDMSQFPNEHHLSSWAGLSPGNNESAGKKKAHE